LTHFKRKYTNQYIQFFLKEKCQFALPVLMYNIVISYSMLMNADVTSQMIR